MNCPKCGKSLWFDHKVCPFCKNVTAEKPMQTASSHPNGLEETDIGVEGEGPWVTLTTCSNMVDADLLISRLEAAGIETYLPDELVMQTAAWNLNTYGYIRVQVAHQDVKAAEAILASTPDTNPSASPDEQATAMGDVPLSTEMKFIGLILALFLCGGFIPFLVARGAYLRQGCDRKAKEWTQWFLIGCAGWLVLYVFVLPRFVSPK